MVSNARVEMEYEPSNPSAIDLVGEGQVQVVRNHPLWKHPMSGYTALRHADIAMNLALYLGESEQRTAVLLTDVDIDENNHCKHALALLVEAMPLATNENIETAIRNVEGVRVTAHCSIPRHSH